MNQSAQSAAHIPTPRQSDGNSLAIFSILQQLDQSQWWSLEQMQQGQLQQLRRLLQHAKQHSAFYKARLADVDALNFTWEDLRDIPVLTRSQLQHANEVIDARPLPSGHGDAKELLTSGSTAMPVRIRATGVTALMWSALNLREHIWHRRDTDKVSASIRWRADVIGKTPVGVTLPDWGAPINQFYSTAPSYYLNSAVDISQQVHWLDQLKPAYLMSHPSNVAALAAAWQQEQRATDFLREIRTVGEMVTAPLRLKLREAFGAPLVDIYSSQELGYIALQCPEYEHYHVQAESLIVEVLREDGSVCAPHEVGKLVITSLRNYATPLLRYEIGDYAMSGDSCACGRGLPVLQAITGRVRNMLRLPDGSRRWPNFGFQKLMGIAELRQFQVVQTGRETIELKLVVDAPLSAQQEQRLQQVLGESLGYPFQIAISYHAGLPRSAGGKFEDFVSLLEAAS